MGVVIRVPPRSYRDLLDASRRLDHARVLTRGEEVLAEVSSDPADTDLVATTLIIVGRSLARLERWPEAVTWIEQGLARLRPGSRTREFADGDPDRLLLVDLQMRLGRWSDAMAGVQELEQPGHRLEIRLGATRARIALATTQSDFATAHQLLNTASDLARRGNGRILAAMVEGDRALVLAAQGRFVEAVGFVDAAVPRLVGAGSSPEQQWANAQAVAVLTGLARLLGQGDDPSDAERMVSLARDPVARIGDSFWTGQLELATSAVKRREGDLDMAEALAQHATQRFSHLGAAPSLALAHLEQARLAEAREWTVSARALYERAGREARTLRMAHEAAEARRALERL